jgi:hypothetical protein
MKGKQQVELSIKEDAAHSPGAWPTPAQTAVSSNCNHAMSTLHSKYCCAIDDAFSCGEFVRRGSDGTVCDASPGLDRDAALAHPTDPEVDRSVFCRCS